MNNGELAPQSADEALPAPSAPTIASTAHGDPFTQSLLRPLVPGDVLVDRFVVQGALATGGSGCVYRARDHISGLEIAVKVFVGAGPVERFAREGGLLAGLQHPAIVRYVDHGVTATGARFVATQLLQGPTLKEVLRKGALSQRQTAQVGVRVLQALAVAHRAGIVHRDIKPENLIVVGEDLSQVTVIDFGVARRMQGHAMTGTGHWVGTPMYMAPEQARGERDVDGRADLFSLGCVLLECLTGQPHFVGDSALAIMAKICVDDDTPLAALCPALHADLLDVLDRLLKKDRMLRAHDAAALAAEVEALLPRLPSECSAVFPTLPAKTIGDVELRVRALILVSPPASASGQGLNASALEPQEMASVSSPLTKLASGFHPLLNGALAFTVPGDAPIDQAVQAARCALAARQAMPARAIAIALGRREETLARPGHGRHVADVTTNLLDETEPGQIRVDDVVAKLLASRFEISQQTNATHTIYHLLAERTSLEPPRTVLGRALPCVGRQREIENLEAIFNECVEESAARVVLVTAPAGGGKSRVRFEVMQRLAASSAGATTLIARADPMHANAPLNLVARMLRLAANITGQESLEVRRKLVRQNLGRHLTAGGLDEAQRERVLAFLGEITDVPFPDDGLPALKTARKDAQVMGDQTRLAWLDWLSAEVNAGPLVMVLEDLHWGDGPSIQFIDEGLRNFSSKALYVMAFARPEIHQRFPQLWEARALETMLLRPLPLRASEQLVAQALPSLSEEDARRLAVRCDGNPFFLEELLRVVSECGGITPTMQSAPASVLGVVQSRFDALGAQAKRVLRAASVYGESFPQAGLAALLGDARLTDLERWLDILSEKEIIYRRSQDSMGLQCSFRHALLRDAAYETLTEGDRISAHNAAVRWLEQAGDCEPMVLVEHYECGRNSERAAHWCAEAAEQTVMTGDLPASIAIAERGKANGAQGETLMRLLLVEGDARCWMGEYAAAETLLKQVVAATEGVQQLKAMSVLLYALGNQSKYDEVFSILDGLKEPANDDEIEHWLRVMMNGAAFTRWANWRLTKELAGRIETWLPNQGSFTYGHWQSLKGSLAKDQGDLSLALQCHAGSEVDFLKAGDAREAASARLMRAVDLLDIGEINAARELFIEVEQTSQRLGITSLLYMCSFNRAQALLRLHSFEQASALAKCCKAFGLRQGDRAIASHSATIDVLACLALGRLDEAADLAAEACEVAQSLGGFIVLPIAAKAAVLLRKGLIEAALHEANAALQVIDSGVPIPDGKLFAFATYVTCSRANGQTGIARSVALRALKELATVASNIREPHYRRTFLRNIPEHAELIQQARSLNINLNTPEFQVLAEFAGEPS
jgi:eukaryotic-like serine/threonine-protein kinase